MRLNLTDAKIFSSSSEHLAAKLQPCEMHLDLQPSFQGAHDYVGHAPPSMRWQGAVPPDKLGIDYIRADETPLAIRSCRLWMRLKAKGKAPMR